MVSVLNYYAVSSNMLGLSKDQSNNMGEFFFMLGTRRIMQKCTVHGGRTKPHIKHMFTPISTGLFLHSICTGGK